ncbi:ATP-binding protein [Sessilibacter corallicola]|uniref:histidine kinase n=1 Tax=Sessilibacter corallicola TaxID=2904075 RepID=A0ABQ0ADZ4_9GAMM
MEEKHNAPIQFFSSNRKSDQTDLDHLNSLDEFFYNQQKVTLDNCEKEPIHCINTIQSYGVLLAIDIDSRQIVAASDNIDKLINLNTSQSSQTLKDVLPVINEALNPHVGKSQGVHSIVADISIEKNPFQCIYHEQQSLGFLEFIPQVDIETRDIRDNLTVLNNATSKIMASDTFQEAMDSAAKAIRTITQFSRIKIYQFQPDWSGKVVAESCADHMASFIGLLFPASDIPRQARVMMSLLPFRAITSVEKDSISNIVTVGNESEHTLDLTFSLLRGVSNMHLAYLRNFGVKSSFTTSLMYDDNLWGCIACHHDEEKSIPFDTWGIVNQLAITLMSKLRQIDAKKSAITINNIRLIEEGINNSIISGDDFENSIHQVLPELREFLNSTGIVFQYGMKTYYDGETPDEDFVEELVTWLRQKYASKNESFSTNALHQHWPRALDYIDNCCGILYEQVHLNQICHLIWIRPPIAKTEHWAGDPTQKQLEKQPDGSDTLLPRNSFSKWVSVHKDLSDDWTTTDTHAAKEILLRMFNIVSSQIELIQHNKNMKTFSYAAAHDIKGPLRYIRIAADTIGEENKKINNKTIEKMGNKALKSANRLSKSIDAMLNFLVIEQQQINFLPIDLNSVLDDAWGILGPKEEYKIIAEQDLPNNLRGNYDLLVTLFQNLFSNSIKFKKPDSELHVIVSSQMENDDITLFVTDNGMGIKLSDKSEIFEPFRRASRSKNIEGSGLGLTICRQIVQLHNGTIHVDNDYQDGTRIVLTFPKVG